MSAYTPSLVPQSTEWLTLPSGKLVRVAKTEPRFRMWMGEFTGDTYNSKPLVDVGGEPMFAELAILRALQKDGWEGVWVDTFRNSYRTSWGNGGVDLPTEKLRLLKSIYARAGARAGCFDVFCWKGEQTLFAESKCSAKDEIRGTQLRWLEAALGVGIPTDSFLIVEWSFAVSRTRYTPDQVHAR